ncbi:hypothetical protein V1512DRAFT_225447 [Lipomyces arxii]|uniref:uncharacterized protein n=1 Tax=Lipomyces arxii TaxID=56418 RepID=UPI0034CF973C
MDRYYYVNKTTAFLFVVVFAVTTAYATRRRWETYARNAFPIYNRLVPQQTNIRGRAGAGYVPGTSAGLLPLHNDPTSAGGSSFEQDIAAGLSSETFNVHANVVAGDSRTGLADDSKREIQNIMRQMHVGFDEARALYTQRIMEQNNIALDGRPQDLRAVFFS